MAVDGASDRVRAFRFWESEARLREPHASVFRVRRFVGIVARRITLVVLRHRFQHPIAFGVAASAGEHYESDPNERGGTETPLRLHLPSSFRTLDHEDRVVSLSNFARFSDSVANACL